MGAAAVPEYWAGAASNFVSQPREQKWYVSPLNVDEPTAFAGSIVIPQTGSVTVAVALVGWFICHVLSLQLTHHQPKSYTSLRKKR